MPKTEKKNSNMHRLNPAGRLLLILKRASQINGEKKGVDAWGPVLGVGETAETPRVLNLMALVLRLPAQIERRVVDLKLDTEQFIDWWRRPFNKSCPYMNLHHPIKTFNDQITAECSTSLSFVSYQLNTQSTSDSAFDPDQLVDIRNDILKLIDKIQASTESSTSLSEYLLRHLFFILDSIEEFRFAGIVPVHTAINATIGSLLTDPDGKPATKTPLGKEFWKLIMKTASVVTITRAGSPLLEKAIATFISSE